METEAQEGTSQVPSLHTQQSWDVDPGVQVRSLAPLLQTLVKLGPCVQETQIRDTPESSQHTRCSLAGAGRSTRYQGGRVSGNQISF